MENTPHQSERHKEFLIIVEIDVRDWVNFSWEFQINLPPPPCPILCWPAPLKDREGIEVGGTQTKLISPQRLLYKLCTCPPKHKETFISPTHPPHCLWDILMTVKQACKNSSNFPKLIFSPLDDLSCRYSVIHNFAEDLTQASQWESTSLQQCELHVSSVTGGLNVYPVGNVEKTWKHAP